MPKHLFYALQRAILASVCLLFCNLAFAAVSVSVNGLPKELANNVKATLSWHRIDTTGLSQAYLQDRLKQSHQEVATALQPFGYYQPSISSSLTQQGNNWQASYEVQAGEPVLVRKLDIKLIGAGAEDSAFSELQANFPLQSQQPLLHSLYEQGKSSISRRLSGMGYLDATLSKANIAVNRKRRSADITLHWKTGKAYHFGELDVENPYISTALLTRWANFKTGDRFNYSQLLAFQRKLDSSGFFEFSHIQIDKQKALGLANVIVDTAPAAKRLYKTSLGYGTDTGARAQLGFEQRWLNQQGHSLLANARVAEREQSYSLSYRIPALSGRADSYTLSWQQRDQQLAEYDTRTSRFSIIEQSHTQQWQIQLSGNVELGDFTIGTIRNKDTLWYLESGWSRFKSNRPVFPDKASSLSINGRLGSGFDQDQKFFGRLQLQYLRVFPAPWDGRFLLRAAAGGLKADNFNLLPPQHRFYAGGDRSVRGFAYQSLSPSDGAGNKIGGRYLSELSIETDYRFAENWAVATFVDAGQAFSSSEHDLAVGTGIGLRFITSLLLIRVDVANAISEDDKPWRLHLSLGADF